VYLQIKTYSFFNQRFDTVFAISGFNFVGLCNFFDEKWEKFSEASDTYVTQILSFPGLILGAFE
jgi:hypothetical protein